MLRKFILIWSAFFTFITSFSQDKSDQDSLAKYSYLVYGTVSTPNPNIYGDVHGTGFFEKRGAKLFFVTAYHVLNAWDPITYHSAIPEDCHYPDKMYIRVYRKNNNQKDSIEINLSGLHNKNDKFHYFEKPDIYKIEIVNYAKYKIYSLESFNDLTLSNQSPVDIVCYGYEASNHGKNPSKSIFKLSSPLEGQIVSDKKDTDVFDYRVTFIGNAGPGYSGAPVFFQSTTRTSITTTFGGMCIGGGDFEENKNPVVTIIKPTVCIVYMYDKILVVSGKVRSFP